MKKKRERSFSPDSHREESLEGSRDWKSGDTEKLLVTELSNGRMVELHGRMKEWKKERQGVGQERDKAKERKNEGE